MRQPYYNYKDAAAQNNHTQMIALLQNITHCLIKNLLVCSTFLWILCESRHLLGIGTRLAVNSDGEFAHTYSAWTKGEGGFSNLDNDEWRPRTPVYLPIFFLISGFIFLLSCICFCIACQKRQGRLWANINANPTRPAFEIYPPINRQGVQPGNINTTPTRPAFETYPPVVREEVRPWNIHSNPTAPALEIHPPMIREEVRPWNIDSNQPRPTLEIYPPVIREEVRPLVSNNDVPPNYTSVVGPNTTEANYNDSLNNYPAVTGGNALETPPPAYTAVAPFK